MTDAFWRFSLALYAKPGVQETCLTLQDAEGADVNLTLFALWCGRAHGRLKTQAIEQAVALSEAWAARAVRPLRALRRDLKPGVPEAAAVIDVEAFRHRVKALELEAERLQQTALADLAAQSAPPSGADAARANFSAYRRAAGATAPDAEAEALFDALLRADAATG